MIALPALLVQKQGTFQVAYSASASCSLASVARSSALARIRLPAIFLTVFVKGPNPTRFSTVATGAEGLCACIPTAVPPSSANSQM